MKMLRLVPALVLSASLVAGAPALPAPGATAPVAIGAAEPEGGSLLLCVASGLLFGASILSGNVLSAAGALVSALGAGCL
jgi:hypothetical protein